MKDSPVTWVKITISIVLCLICTACAIIWRLTIPAIIVLSVCKITMDIYPFSWFFTISVPVVTGTIALITNVITGILGKAILD